MGGRDRNRNGGCCVRTSLPALDTALRPTCLDGDMTVASEAQDDALLGPGEAEGQYHRRQRQKARDRSLDDSHPHRSEVSLTPDLQSSSRFGLPMKRRNPPDPAGLTALHAATRAIVCVPHGLGFGFKRARR